MQAGHLLEDGRGDVGTARRDLVALRAADDVLEQEREPAGLGLDLGDVGAGDPGADPGGHLAVEADLDLVGPQGQTGAPALVVGRGELAHDAGRTRRPARRRSRAKRVVSAIWPVPIGSVVERGHPGARRRAGPRPASTAVSHSGVTSAARRRSVVGLMAGRDYAPRAKSPPGRPAQPLPLSGRGWARSVLGPGTRSKM